MSLHTIESFEVLPEGDKVLITFHEEDAPSWFGKSVLNRRGASRNQLLVFEGMGPDGSFEIGFGPVTQGLADRMTTFTQLTFVALAESGPVYAVELRTE